jgi:type II secretory pathway component GspD/PulD (secretin)
MHIAERERMIENLAAQIRQARAQQPPKRTRGEQTQLQIFPLKNIEAEAAFVIVREFITDGRGIIVPVLHTNSLIIRDTPKNLRDIETIIKHIDVSR